MCGRGLGGAFAHSMRLFISVYIMQAVYGGPLAALTCEHRNQSRVSNGGRGGPDESMQCRSVLTVDEAETAFQPVDKVALTASAKPPGLRKFFTWLEQLRPEDASTPMSLHTLSHGFGGSSPSPAQRSYAVQTGLRISIEQSDAASMLAVSQRLETGLAGA